MSCIIYFNSMKYTSKNEQILFPYVSRANKGHASTSLFFAKLLSLCICLVVLSGCATLAEKEKAEALDETTTKYGTALRFGYIDVARSFIRSPEKSMGDLSGIKITSYEIVGKELSADKLQAQQVVEIQYYYTDNLIEKTLQDVQIWKYDVSKERWYLHSGLPVFK